ncbi:hypothetical protein EDD15DRAFT_2231450 [Pisolithus albus]|nr:hypothetical protein EDD15DRAFT_2231450 [Pisolithus albus]
MKSGSRTDTMGTFILTFAAFPTFRVIICCQRSLIFFLGFPVCFSRFIHYLCTLYLLQNLTASYFMSQGSV